MIYVTSLPKIFGIEKYANELNKIVQARNIAVYNRQALKKVDTDSKTATFDILDENSQPTGKEQSLQVRRFKFFPKFHRLYEGSKKRFSFDLF